MVKAFEAVLFLRYELKIHCFEAACIIGVRAPQTHFFTLCSSFKRAVIPQAKGHLNHTAKEPRRQPRFSMFFITFAQRS